MQPSDRSVLSIKSDFHGQVISERTVAWHCSELQRILGKAASVLRILRGRGSVENCVRVPLTSYRTLGDQAHRSS